MRFHLAVCCDASCSLPPLLQEAGIGVSVVLVDCEDHSNEIDILYAWTKQRARTPDRAELMAIRCACICLNCMDDVMRRLNDFLARTDQLVSAQVFNDCQTAVKQLTTSQDYELIQKHFLSRYGCELQVTWECNQGHSPQSCLALVDRMVNEARLNLFIDHWVLTFAKPPEGGNLPSSLPDAHMRPGPLSSLIPDHSAGSGSPALAAIVPSAAGTAASAASCPTEDRPTPFKPPFDLNTMD